MTIEQKIRKMEELSAALHKHVQRINDQEPSDLREQMIATDMAVEAMKKLNILELNRMQLADYREAQKVPFVVVLDNVRSLHNVGSVFRTSDAYRVESIYLCGVTATPPSAEIHKTALGAEDSVAWHYYKDTREAVEQLREEGYTVYSIEQVQGSIALQDLQLEKGKKYAVILGNEVKGVQQEVVDMSDGCIELPQYGTKHSLNVSVTAGIVIWEFARQLLIE